MGEPDTILIRPGYDDDAVYTQARDGQLQPPAISTAAQAFYNYALLPGWQKWKPTYRIGTITEIDGNNCTVQLDAAISVAQALDVNQAETLTGVTIDYMSCDGAAFEVGDRVVVQFTDQKWDNPRVIGFEEEPQPCNIPLIAFYGENVGLDGWALYSPVNDAFVPVAAYAAFSVPDATAYVSGPDAQHHLVMWLGTYVGAVTKNLSFSDNIWDAYDNGKIIAYTNQTGTQINTQFEKTDMHRVTMEHVEPAILYSKIYENPDWESAWIIEERWSINDETGEFTRESSSDTYHGDVSSENQLDPLNIPFDVYDWPYFYFDPEAGEFVVSKWKSSATISQTENETEFSYTAAFSQSDTYTVGCLDTEQMTAGGSATTNRTWNGTWNHDYISDAPFSQRPWRPFYPVPAFYESDGATHAEEHDSITETTFPTTQTYSIDHLTTVSLAKDQIVSYSPYVLHQYTQSETLKDSDTTDYIRSYDDIVASLTGVVLTTTIVQERTLEKYSIARAGNKTIKVVATDLDQQILIDGEDKTTHLQSLYTALTGQTLGLTGLYAICYNSPPEED